jgi:hypothetical protein
MQIDPPRVSLDRDCLFSLRVTAPTGMDVRLPELGGRVAGMTINSTYDRDPTSTDATVTVERLASLTPQVAETYRIAPMAIGYRPHGSSAPWTWATTPPLVLELTPLIDGPPSGTIQDNFDPRWIRPSATTLTLIALGGLATVAILVGLVLLLRHIRRQARLRRLSPRERALEELRLLLLRKLVEKHRIKDFYVELTMVVRRYIERAHHVQAPEQTTEEFLQAVSHDTRFAPDVIARLRAFLEAADLVKFAAHQPDTEAIDDATRTAREYIATDDEATGEGHGNDRSAPDHSPRHLNSRRPAGPGRKRLNHEPLNPEPPPHV